MSGAIAYENWSTRLRRSCGHYYSRRGHADKSIWGHFQLRDRMGVDMADIACDIERVERTRRGIRMDSAEHMFLLFQLRGQTGMQHQGESLLLAPGEFALLDSTRPAELRYGNRRSHFLSLHLPRGDFLASADTPVTVARKRPASHPIAAALRSALLCVEDQRSEDQPLQAEFLYSLVRLAFGEMNCTRKARQGRERQQLIDQTIDRNLTDPDLDITRLASMVGLSVRQLQRDLAAQGEGFVQLLRRKRLALMAERLRKHKGKHRPSISELAYGCGFGDLSNFNRQFRHAFGCTPGEFRNRNA